MSQEIKTVNISMTPHALETLLEQASESYDTYILQFDYLSRIREQMQEYDEADAAAVRTFVADLCDEKEDELKTKMEKLEQAMKQAREASVAPNYKYTGSKQMQIGAEETPSWTAHDDHTKPGYINLCSGPLE